MSEQLLDGLEKDEKSKDYLVSRGWRYIASTGWEYTDVNGYKYYRNNIMDARTLQNEWERELGNKPYSHSFKIGELIETTAGQVFKLASPDMVNSPPHYNQAGIEVIDVIEAYAPDSYHLGNVIKYVCRSGHKGQRLQDYRKARWYLDRLIENEENNGTDTVPDVSREQGNPRRYRR